jgi:hypothetical protein
MILAANLGNKEGRNQPDVLTVYGTVAQEIKVPNDTTD